MRRQFSSHFGNFKIQILFSNSILFSESCWPKNRLKKNCRKFGCTVSTIKNASFSSQYFLLFTSVFSLYLVIVTQWKGWVLLLLLLLFYPILWKRWKKCDSTSRGDVLRLSKKLAVLVQTLSMINWQFVNLFFLEIYTGLEFLRKIRKIVYKSYRGLRIWAPGL